MKDPSFCQKDSRFVKASYYFTPETVIQILDHLVVTHYPNSYWALDNVYTTKFT
jgi:hypothetical protein